MKLEVGATVPGVLDPHNNAKIAKHLSDSLGSKVLLELSKAGAIGHPFVVRIDEGAGQLNIVDQPEAPPIPVKKLIAHVEPIWYNHTLINTEAKAMSIDKVTNWVGIIFLLLAIIAHLNIIPQFLEIYLLIVGVGVLFYLQGKYGKEFQQKVADEVGKVLGHKANG